MKKWMLRLGTVGATVTPIVAVVSCSSNSADKETTREHLQELFKSIFPSWPTVLATVLALLILLFVLSKFLYHPIKDAVANRRKYIQNNIDKSEESLKQAYSDRELANDELIKAKIEAAQIIANAKIEAIKVKASKKAKATKEASKIITDAKEQVKIDKAKFEKESKEAIVNVALEAAAKVVEKEVDNKTNRKIVEDFIKAK